MATGAATETTLRADTGAHAAGHATGKTHTTDRGYIVIALILAAITAAETSTYFIDWFKDDATRQWIFLAPLMIIKFSMVAWFFMHLKNDSRLFTRLFASGVALAIGVYIVVILAFDEIF